MTSVVANTPTTREIATIDATAVAATAERARDLRKAANEMVRGASTDETESDVE